MNYDTWLEETYERQAAATDAYQDWCEANGLDPETAERQYEIERELAEIEQLGQDYEYEYADSGDYDDYNEY